jgi:hypothetical protein
MFKIQLKQKAIVELFDSLFLYFSSQNYHHFRQLNAPFFLTPPSINMVDITCSSASRSPSYRGQCEGCRNSTAAASSPSPSESVNRNQIEQIAALIDARHRSNRFSRRIELSSANHHQPRTLRDSIDTCQIEMGVAVDCVCVLDLLCRSLNQFLAQHHNRSPFAGKPSMLHISSHFDRIRPL